MRFALLLFGILALAAPLRAADKLWVALYVGENHNGGPQAPPKMADRLRQVFGFTNYKLLKGENVDLKDNDHWVLSRKDFFLRLRPLAHAAEDPVRIGYEIYKDGFLIADGAYLVNEDTPLFISGPDFHRGRLIFVLEAK
jgi:hypothetical protein